jgi:hypothetical protein
MPLARYFLFVGGVLLALLFIADAYLPKLPVADRAIANLPVIRIHSDRKWPERVVFDTNRPTVVPVQVADTGGSAPAPAISSQASAISEASSQARMREAFAQLQPPDAKLLRPSVTKKAELKSPPRRKVARRRAPPPAMLVAQQPQPQFGFFANNSW